MNAISAGLKKLHDLQIQLREVTDDLERGPRQIQAKKTFVERKQADLTAKRDKLKQTKVLADQKNLQLKTLQAKLADLNSKLNIASSNREYDIIKGQIDADKMASSVLEDEILETLEKVDEVQKEVKVAEEEVAAAEVELKKTTDAVNAAKPGLDTRADELRAKVKEAEVFLPGDTKETYVRLVQTYGAEALAPVQSKSCSNCNVGLTMQLLMEVTSGQIRFCRTCGRLLYAPPKD